MVLDTQSMYSSIMPVLSWGISSQRNNTTPIDAQIDHLSKRVYRFISEVLGAECSLENFLDWQSKYVEWDKLQKQQEQQNENQFLNKAVLVRFSDGSEWNIPLFDLASVAQLSDEDYASVPLESLILCADSLVRWASENLTWDQIMNIAVQQSPPQLYVSEWKTATKEVCFVGELDENDEEQ